MIDHLWSFPAWMQFPGNYYSTIKPWYASFIIVVLHLAITPHTRAIKVKVSLEFLTLSLFQPLQMEVKQKVMCCLKHSMPE